MTPRYFIDSELCRGIKIGSDLYVEGEIKHIQNTCNISEENISRVRLTLLKVSERNETESPLSYNKDRKQYLRPKEREYVDFNISNDLYNAMLNDDKHICEVMPLSMKFQNDDKTGRRLKMIGSIIFESPESDEVKLSIIRSDESKDL